MRRALAITTLLLALVAAIARIRYAPPAPLPRDAPSDTFSAERARDVQKEISAAPTRMTGSKGNAEGRAILAAALEKAGFRVERQKGFSCTYHGFCAPIENVIGIREGAEPGILLVAHHDSVPVSPGASDDGAGASTIVEAARALAKGPPLKHLLVVLLTDGEEDGLLGAEAFAHESPWAKRVRVTINVDSRGSTGPSEMFETSRGNAWLVETMAQHVKHPATSSLFYEVYKRMPNDTDFTVLKTLGSGVNFANIAHIEHYHTPLDSFAHADPATLQHHGDNVVAMTRGLDVLDLAHPPATGDANWFDVLSFGIVRWPEKVTLPLAVIVLVLTAATALRLRAFGLGLATGPSMLIVAIASAYLVGALLKVTGAVPAPWIAHPAAASAALHFATFAGAIAVAYLLRRTNPRAIWAGTWLTWSLVAAGAATVAPGTAFFFLVPVIVATLVTVISFEAGCIAGSVAAAVIAFPLAHALHDALGFVAAPLAALPTVFLVTTIAPMIGHVSRRAPSLLGGASLLFALLALAIPKFSSEVPQRANVVFRQDETGDAKVFVDTAWGPTTWGDPPKPMVAALGDPKKLGREQPFAWTIDALVASADRIEAPLPEANVRATHVGGGRRKVTIVARSPRRAPMIALVLPATRAMSIKVEGKNAIPRWGYVLGLKAVPDHGIEVEIDAAGEDPIAVSLLDRTFGVPDGTIASAAASARPATATQTQDGDVTVLVRTLTF